MERSWGLKKERYQVGDQYKRVENGKNWNFEEMNMQEESECKKPIQGLSHLMKIIF